MNIIYAKNKESLHCVQTLFFILLNFGLRRWLQGLTFSVSVDLIECTMRCETYSSEKQIALSLWKPESFILRNLPSLMAMF